MNIKKLKIHFGDAQMNDTILIATFVNSKMHFINTINAKV